MERQVAGDNGSGAIFLKAADLAAEGEGGSDARFPSDAVTKASTTSGGTPESGSDETIAERALGKRRGAARAASNVTAGIKRILHK